jgi:hypothetical protein
MKSPNQQTIAEWTLALVQFCTEQVEYTPLTEQASCRGCGTEIKAVGCSVTLHENTVDGSCGNNSRTQIIVVPFCPACEPEPERTGCIHIPLSSSREKAAA